MSDILRRLQLHRTGGNRSFKRHEAAGGNKTRELEIVQKRVSTAISENELTLSLFNIAMV